jgi:hypothetical protein
LAHFVISPRRAEDNHPPQRATSEGYLLAAPILILCTLIGFVVIGQTISQTLEGIVFPFGVYIGRIGSWVVMGAFAIWLTILYFNKIDWRTDTHHQTGGRKIAKPAR